MQFQPRLSSTRSLTGAHYGSGELVSYQKQQQNEGQGFFRQFDGLQEMGCKTSQRSKWFLKYKVSFAYGGNLINVKQF